MDTSPLDHFDVAGRPISGPPVPTRLITGPPAELRVSVAMVPYLTVFGAASEGLQACHRGLDPGIRRQVASAVHGIGDRIFDLDADTRWPLLWPEFAIPTLVGPSVPLNASIEMVRDTPPAAVADQIGTIFADHVPAQWRKAHRNPRRFQQDFSLLLGAAGHALSGLWSASRPVLERERRRLDLALRTGRIDLALGSLTPKLRYADQSIVVGEDWGLGDVALAGRPLVLMPMIAGPAMLVSNLDSAEDVVWFGYPVTVSALDSTRTDAGALEVLLGSQRAVLLRYLHRPTGMAEVARLLQATPANATHHVNQLASAGLVIKHRRGREIRIHRTDVGSELIDLLDGRPTPRFRK